MRIIPIFLIGIGLLTACTTEPERPDDTPEEEPPPAPVLVCEEACAADADCGPVPADAPVGARSVCGADKRCVLTHVPFYVASSNHTTTTCAADADCGDGACVGGLCFACAVPEMGDPTQPSKYCKEPGRPFCVFDATDPGLTSCSECIDDAQCAGSKTGSHRCASVPVPATAAPFGNDPATGTVNLCVCDTDASCKEPGRNTCRAEGCVCTTDEGCATGESCFFGVCTACSDDASCAAKDDGDPATPNPAKCFGGGAPGAYCGCTRDTQCAPTSAGDPTFCDVPTGTCVECRTNADCKGDLPVCVGAGAAGAFCGCGKNADCAGSGAGAICNVEAGTCTECVEDADCSAQKLGSVCAEGSCTCSAGTECAAPKSAPGLKWVCE